MLDPTVTLRLSGSGRADRLRAWIACLARVSGHRRMLQVFGPDDLPPDLRRWCADAGVELAATLPSVQGRADVLVLAGADDLPTPGMLHRLVAATSGSTYAWETRVLPYGAVTDSSDADPEVAPTVCLAIPGSAGDEVLGTATPGAATSACREAGVHVRRLDSATVFVDRRPAGTVAPVVGDDAGAPPYGHPAALPATSLHQLMGETELTPPDLPRDLEDRPFLTVITRTQGTRLLCLEETLTCLAGQSSRDFELVLACHRVSAEALAAARALLGRMPAWLQEQTRVLAVERHGRSAPLNDALDVARGRYAVMLDDDDVVTADWVAAFAEAEARGPGTVLRSAALAQEVRPDVGEEVDGPTPVEVGPAHPVWPAEFSFVDHLWDNGSPPMTFAVPRGVFGDLGHRFDEALDTTEDWEFLLRAAIVTGVTSTPAVTAVYRVWTDGEGSRHLHDAAEWAAAREAVLATVDQHVVLLPPGAARGIRDLHQALLDERAEKFRFAGLNEQAARDLVAVNDAVVALRARIAELEERLARQRRRNRKPE